MLMKILHVTSYYPPHLGGMENTVKELAERTAEMGHEVSVYTSDKIGNKPKLLSKKNLQIYYLRSIEIGHTSIMPSLPLRSMRNINKDTIVHIHFAIAYASEIAMITAKIKGAKIVSHIHIDPLPSGSLGFLLPVYKGLFWKRILPLSDVVICPTEDYIGIVSQKYGVKRDKCITVPSGIDLKKFTPVNEFRNSNEVTDLLFVGRLVKQKNLPMLLNAFKLVQNKYDLTLHIVGDGEERAAIGRIIAKENIANVILHGRVSAEELMKLYLTSDIFVLPSDYESFGIVNLEAMASGLPIVASDISGMRNVLKDCGILVTPTPENFADAIVRLIENKDLRNKLVKRGRERVKEYDWKKITKKVIGIYAECVHA
jgi:glycosyltransferase involved in cell wall biosynthesis